MTSENIQKRCDAIMRILLSYDEQEIGNILNGQGFARKNLFRINKLTNGKYVVTLGFNYDGEDICSKELNTYLDAYRFAAIRTLLSYKVKFIK